MATWPELTDQWRHAEQLGFDSIWISDHFAPGWNHDTPWFEAWTALAALAALTPRVRVGTNVTSITLRHPAMLARQAMTLDHISGGRLEIGIGSGGSPHDFAVTGVGPWKATERYERLEETVQILDGLLVEGALTHRGAHYSVDGAVINPRPVQQPRPPLIVASHGRRGLDLVARLADGWNSLGRHDTPGNEPKRLSVRVQETADMGAELDELCVAAGRDPATVRRTVTLDASFRAFTSQQAFETIITRYHRVGIDEFILMRPGWLQDPEEVARELVIMEQVAAEFPRLRAALTRARAS